MLILLFISLTAGQVMQMPVILTPAQQDACIDNDGYLQAPSSTYDCCSFIVCDASNLNKTGYVGQCMGGTAWNQDFTVCDDPKYVTGCDPKNDCTVPKRTAPLCDSNELTSDDCCVGDRLPIFRKTGLTTYSVFGNQQTCPENMVFSQSDCACISDIDPEDFVTPCDDTTHLYFDNPNDPCCSYIQCFPNRTSFVVQSCAPPLIWDDMEKTCRNRMFVMDCIGAFCGNEDMDITDPPCPTIAADDSNDHCCLAGIVYQDLGNNMYAMVDDYGIPGLQMVQRLNMCPLNMVNEQMIFNFEDCCCEDPPAAP